ncbi:MAG: S41 family peptidase [Lachnospiraceae bacterium]|nr:S41 family peptidase [Lachnospiraceae bacterium]
MERINLNQNGDNNYYNNDYSRGNINQSTNSPYYQQPASVPPQYPYPPAGGQNSKGGGVFLLGLLVGVIITALVGSCAYVGTRLYHLAGSRSAKTASADGSAGNSLVNDDTLEKLEALEEVIGEYYYKDEDIDVEEMTEGMYSGLVASLGDPYSVYYTAEEWKELLADTEGIYYGIGAYLQLDTATGLAKINGVIANTPAEEAGLRENDIIYQVDGEMIQGLELSEIVSRVKGEEGTTVHLTIVREGETDYLEINVERRKIESPTVKYEIYDNGVGYIQITEFDDVTTDQFTEALAVVKGSGAKGLILDLRSNPGGSLPVVVDIARSILPKGLIVYTEDKYGKRDEYTCDGKKELDIPMVVLINGNSASASEILAGAIKDYDKGTLIGTTTFGKGIVQRVLPLTDGTALKLTISSYYTPKGNNIHGIGIDPDIECEFDSEAYYERGVDNQLESAKQEISRMIK